MNGTVIDVFRFLIAKGEKLGRIAQSIIDAELERYRIDLDDRFRITQNDIFERLQKVLVGQTVNGGPSSKDGVRLKKGDQLTADYLENLDPNFWFDIRLADEETQVTLEHAKESIDFWACRNRAHVRWEEKETHSRWWVASVRDQDGQSLPSR